MRTPMKSERVSKLPGVALAAGMVIALAGSFCGATPAAADTTKWTTLNTPSWQDGVILPASDMLDYDLGAADGSTIYVVAELDRTCEQENPFLSHNVDPSFGYGVFQSIDGGVTWADITENVIDADNLPDCNGDGISDAGDILSLNFVAVAPDNPDWVAVTGYANYGAGPSATEPDVFTVASKDGGDNFDYAGDMKDTSHGTTMDIAYDTEVSPEFEDIHVIAVMGAYDANNDGVATVSGLDQGTVFSLNAGAWLSKTWEDTADYEGWDGDPAGNAGGFPNSGISTYAVIDGRFSPNYADDCTLVVIGIAPSSSGHGTPYVQTGDLTGKQWGAVAAMPDPIKITSSDNEVWIEPGIWEAAIALPADYYGTDSEARVVFGYADAYNTANGLVRACLFRLNDEEETSLCGPTSNNPLASIDIYGDANDSKMILGEYAEWDDKIGDFAGMLPADPCVGVAVWHTEELDVCTCCPLWGACCKCPSGTYVAHVRYTPDGEKQYATTTSSDGGYAYNGFTLPGTGECAPGESWGTPGDETAFSVSRDDALSFNQLGLIDTNIETLSDFVVCPDCSVAYLSTVNEGEIPGYDCPDGFECPLSCWSFACDSIWRTFDNGDTWERVFHGDWTDDTDANSQALLLRLPCSDTENCCDYTDPYFPSGTIYLGVQGTDDLFYSRDCGQCWVQDPDTLITIEDFAVDTEGTVYVLDEDGNVSMSTNFGHLWYDAVDTGAGSGHMITLCCADGLVVVSPENESGSDSVAWSDDEGDTWNTTDDIPIAGEVHIACATTCDNIIYIAVDPPGCSGGIYRTDITDGSWDDLDAVPADYTGIAVGKSDGTLYASTDFICTSGFASDETPCDQTFFCGGLSVTDGQQDQPDYSCYSAVARDLDPCTTECCGNENWDYLICGLSPQDGECSGEYFSSQTNALDICGCLTSTTNTILYAIDQVDYDVRDGSDGTVWTYEDCAAKVGPTLLSPADDSVIDCQNCNLCGAAPFNFKWDRLCNSCSYDMEIMDDQGNVVISLVDFQVTGATCTFYFNPSAIDDSDFDSDSVFSQLVCGSSYQWHVREANTDCECIHSRWSDTWTFTIATSSQNGVQLIAPKMSATSVNNTNAGFSWTSVPGATNYNFVLSPNANLTGSLASLEVSTTAFNYAGPLDYGATYYWQVKAWKDSTLLSTSDVGVFTVMPEPVAPTAPTTVEETPPPQVNIPPTKQVTPTWIYLAVGITMALVVVVVVLLVRRRRL